MAAQDNKVFSGYHTCQLVKNYRRFREYLSPPSDPDERETDGR
jgi:hypothetical protein